MPKLSPRQKEIVDLLMQDYSSKEVGAILGLKTTHTSNYLWRARKNFRVNTTHGLLIKILKQNE